MLAPSWKFLTTYSVGFGFQKQSEFLKLFDYFISENIENEHIKRIKMKWFNDASSNCGTSQKLDSMGFYNVISAYKCI